MKRHRVNVKETAFQPRENSNRKFTNLQRSPQGLQQGRNTTPCYKIHIVPNINSCMLKEYSLCLNIIKNVHVLKYYRHIYKPITTIPDLVQAHETWYGVNQFIGYSTVPQRVVKGKNQRNQSSNRRTTKLKQRITHRFIL